MAEKLHEPLRLAKALGVRVLLEPHGVLTDSIDGMQAILDKLSNPNNLCVNMDPETPGWAAQIRWKF